MAERYLFNRFEHTKLHARFSREKLRLTTTISEPGASDSALGSVEQLETEVVRIGTGGKLVRLLLFFRVDSRLVAEAIQRPAFVPEGEVKVGALA